MKNLFKIARKKSIYEGVRVKNIPIWSITML